MPNHVTNIVDFSGIDAEKAALALYEDGEFNFGFAPMPKELVGTRSPAKVVSEAELAVEIVEFEARDYKEAMGRSFSLTREQSDTLIMKYGTNNWYDWACDNWGTKWAGYDGDLITPTQCMFQTAWSTPFPAMVLLSLKYPEVTLIVQFSDEDFGSNVGTYEILNGIKIVDNVPEYGYESLEMAFKIQGEKEYQLDWIFEQFEDTNEGQEKFHSELDTNDYIAWAADKIVELSYLPDGHISVFILKYLEKQSVTAQNFELAKDIKERIDGIVGETK